MNIFEVNKVCKVLKGYKVLLTFGFINFITFNCWSQHKQFDTIEYRVMQQANANISNGAKINSNPTIADTTKPSRKVDYTTIGSQFPTSYTPDALKPIQLKGEPLENYQHSMLNLGGGNYGTPYVEYFFNSVRSRDWDYGIHLNHLSSSYVAANGYPADFSYNDVNLYGTAFLQDHTFTAKADFDQHVVNDFGVILPNDGIVGPYAAPLDTRQRYNLFDGKLQYTSHYKDSGKIHHDIKMSYYNYQGLYLDNYTTTEQNVNVNAHLFTYIEKQRIDVKALVQYYNEDNILGANHAWDLGLNPYFSASEKHWDAHLGLKAYLDAVNGGTDIFPDLLVRYHIADDALIIYAGIDGDKEYNSYKSLSAENPYVQDTVSNLYTRTMYHLFLGFTGSITKEITYDINGSQSEVKGMPFYVTDTNEFYRNRFAVVYDNVKIVNVHADIGYQLKENVRFVLGGDLYQYMTTDQLEAWYHPTLKINLGGEYRVNEKLLLKTNLIFVNSQYAPEYVDGVLTAKTLAGYPDLNLGADYKYNKLLTAFLNLNNLANTAYMQWDNYPTQRFNFLLGVRLTF